MASVFELLLIFVVLTNLVLLGTSRLALCIHVLAAQGIALGLSAVLLPEHDVSVRVGAIAAAGIVIKGLLFPRLLARAMRDANVRHEMEPMVGYVASLLAGVLMLGLSLWLARRLGLPGFEDMPLILSTALFGLFTGLFLIVSRRQAITQVMGYLALENGIYLFGVTLARDEPFLVEMGILLDVLVAVFVMGITIFHISREFDHVNVDELTSLKD